MSDLKPCEWCGNLKGYPFRSSGSGIYGDGVTYSYPTVRYRCWQCKEVHEAAQKARDREEHQKLQQVAAKFRAGQS